MNFLIYFSALTSLNVVLSTVKSIVTIKGNKTVASLVSGFYYGFYNIVLISTVADFPLWQKCLITFICNVFGVWIVKWCEEKARKDRLWKIESTVTPQQRIFICGLLKTSDIPCNYIEGIGKHNIVNIYCATQEQSAKVKEILARCNAKYFVSESKIL